MSSDLATLGRVRSELHDELASKEVQLAKLILPPTVTIRKPRHCGIPRVIAPGGYVGEDQPGEYGGESGEGRSSMPSPTDDLGLESTKEVTATSAMANNSMANSSPPGTAPAGVPFGREQVQSGLRGGVSVSPYSPPPSTALLPPPFSPPSPSLSLPQPCGDVDVTSLVFSSGSSTGSSTCSSFPSMPSLIRDATRKRRRPGREDTARKGNLVVNGNKENDDVDVTVDVDEDGARPGVRRRTLRELFRY